MCLSGAAWSICGIWHCRPCHFFAEQFGIKGQALNWVESYVNKCSKFVVADGVKSEEHEVDCNITQWSVMGLSMFGDYSSLVEQHGVSFRFYDMQSYVYFSVGEEAEALKRLELCIHDAWICIMQNYCLPRTELYPRNLGCMAAGEDIGRLF